VQVDLSDSIDPCIHTKTPLLHPYIRAACCDFNDTDLHSGGTRFELRPGHLLSSLTFLVLSINLFKGITRYCTKCFKIPSFHGHHNHHFVGAMRITGQNVFTSGRSKYCSSVRFSTYVAASYQASLLIRPPTTGYENPGLFPQRHLLHLEDGGSKFLRNFGIPPQHYRMS
jgi:hypothetical protein